jgi:hypothetical protein
MRRQRAGGRFGMMRLGGEDDRVPSAAQGFRRERRHQLHELGDRPGDGDADGVDRRHVVGVGIDERDFMAGAGEVRAESATDRASAPDEESHLPKALAGVAP